MARLLSLSTSMFSGVSRRSLLGLIPVLILLIYSNTWDASFHLDDDINIVENRAIQIKTLDLSSLIRAGFQSPLPNRFVANMSFALNYYFGGLHAFGYHWINTLIHLGTAFFLYLFLSQTFSLQRLSRSIPFPGEAAAVAALLWAVHPVQTQSVTYIVQRMTSLSAFFYLLAFILYIQGRKKMEGGRFVSPSRFGYWYFGSGAAALLSLGSKETAITLPMMIVLYDFLFFSGEDREKIKKAVPFYLMLLIGTGVIALLYLWGATGVFGALQKGISKQYGVDYVPWDLRLMTGARVLVYYLSLLLFPHPSRLNLDYDFPLSYSILHPPTTLLSAIALIGSFFLRVVFMEEKAAFCLFLFLVFWKSPARINCSTARSGLRASPLSPFDRLFRRHRPRIAAVGLGRLFGMGRSCCFRFPDRSDLCSCILDIRTQSGLAGGGHPLARYHIEISAESSPL